MPGIDIDKLPTHVAIIMDGNGRWAKKRGLKRAEGHLVGIESVREIVTITRELNIPYLTLYAFSMENWSRPTNEVKTLLEFLGFYLDNELPMMLEKGIRFHMLGEKRDFPRPLQVKLDEVTARTARNKKLHLNIALSYSGRKEIISAVKRIADDTKNGTIRKIDERLFSRYLYTKGMPDPDLLIRTSGEMRLSNFLLWQVAYTEIYVTNVLWPDFRRKAYMAALRDFAKRERRFGKVKEG
jgi:undecaprenyl diphosphate synthase